jgi:hypothetical protein
MVKPRMRVPGVLLIFFMETLRDPLYEVKHISSAQAYCRHHAVRFGSARHRGAHLVGNSAAHQTGTGPCHDKRHGRTGFGSCSQQNQQRRGRQSIGEGADSGENLAGKFSKKLWKLGKHTQFGCSIKQCNQVGEQPRSMEERSTLAFAATNNDRQTIVAALKA